MNIEELAFKNYYELKDTQKVDLLLIIDCLQKDRKQWINQYTQAHNDYVNLRQENQQLKEKIKTYEEPEDLTLMFMYCDEKAKDKIKQLQSVIKEIREYINKNKLYNYKYDEEELFEIITDEVAKTDLLQIIDKGDK